MFFVTDEGFHLGRVADRFTSEMLQSSFGSMFALGGLGGMIAKKTMVEPSVAHRQSLEARYSSVDAGGAEFMTFDKRNYSIEKDAVSGAALDSVGNAAKMQQRVGFLQLQMKDGKSLKFELASPLAPADVEKLIRVIVPDAQGNLV